MEGRIAFERLLTRLANIRYNPGKNDSRHGPNHVLRGFRELVAGVRAGLRGGGERDHAV